MFTSPLPPLWYHNPRGHLGKRAVIPPDTCQPTSHKGLSCVTPNDIAWQDQSWATLYPILPPGEVGRTMLIASDPPRARREIAFIRCNNGMELFNGKLVAAMCTDPSRSLCPCACGEMMWLESYLVTSPETIPNKCRGCSHSQPSHISQPSSYKNTCLDPTT